MSEATYETHRICPYCSARVRLSECPIVATNYEGVEFRVADELQLEEVELPSGAKPLRLLPKTSWPVVAEAPASRLSEREARQGNRSAFEQAFGAKEATGRALPSLLEEEGVAREDLPARACLGCEFPLPTTIDARPAVVVAVVGVNRVGKTHLLASCLTEAYRQHGLATIGCTEFTPDDPTGMRFVNDYFTPLFRHGELLDMTSAEDEEVRFQPLVFNVTIEGIEPFSLVLHDVAGEVLGDQRKRALSATYLRSARGLIFVIDPRDIDGLRGRLPRWMLESNELGWDQGTLLSTCLRADGILDGKGPVPVAVAVAKADLLPQACGEELPFLTPGQTPEPTAEFTSRVRAYSEQVEAFLERYRAHHILAPIREYQRRTNGGNAGVTFHAVSALGSAPDADERLTGAVAPINCLDPLASVLLQLSSN